MKLQVYYTSTRVALLTLAAAMMGCGRVDSESLSGHRRALLPANAVVERDLGNGWVVFSVDGREYIYRLRRLGADSATEVLAPY